MFYSTIIEYALPAVIGAATRTYMDCRDNAVDFFTVLGMFFMNAIIAVSAGCYCAYLFVNAYPDEQHFGYSIASLAGATALSIILGAAKVEWRKLVQSLVSK